MGNENFSISGQIADVVNGRIYPGEIHISEGRIAGISEKADAPSQLIAPGLVDAHIHIESSLLVPSEFSRLATVHGTVATVSDPHEIANVTGMRGVEYMLENAAKVPFYFNFGAPSCVPATAFETAGAVIGVEEIEQLLARDEIRYLSEMMNYPGVLYAEEEVMQKIAIAKKYGKPVDGHAPGLRGEEARKYIEAGISTDHECFTREEALDKLKYGMKILIREGSAARNFDALIDLMATHPEHLMFCSDDKHPDSLLLNHIDDLIRRAISGGFNPMHVLRAATLNPVKHYGLQCGLLQLGDPADLIIAESMQDFRVKETWIKGNKVAENGRSLIECYRAGIINHFDCTYINSDDLKIKARQQRIRIIDVIEGQLITRQIIEDGKIENELLVSDPERDILKLAVVNRYKNAEPAIGFVHHMGIKQGAIASTVAHDSHNIIAVGADDDSLKHAINLLIKNKGGLSVVNGEQEMVLPLPVAGLMSPDDGYKVANDYIAIDEAARNCGTHLAAPFMTLSFLALLVIPELKLSDKGLFDGGKFQFTNLFAE